MTLLEAAQLAERTLVSTLKARGYQPGSSVDGWSQEVRQEVATLATLRRVLAREETLATLRALDQEA